DKFTYPMRGIQGLIDGLEQDVIRKGGKIIRKADTTHIDVQKRVITYKVGGKEHSEVYDALINTIPVEEFLKFTKGIPKEYSDNLKKLKYTPVVGILFGTKDFIDPENYWINFFGERVHVMYQHSLLVDKYRTKITWVDRYGGSAEDLAKSDDEIKDLYLGAVRKYFPKMDVKFCLVFRDKYAEPIYDRDYAKYCPKYRTPIQGLYNAGIQVTFPKIRNMNVALESGEKVAGILLEDFK
ncbi:MAG: FAD-dependent oxidoreductase, partial [Candidatus Woesearchaeota archaeon]